jgi:predicted transcriptional regulator
MTDDPWGSSRRAATGDDTAVMISLRIPKDLRERVRRLALQTGMPRTWVYNRLIRRGLGLGVGPEFIEHVKQQTEDGHDGCGE